METPQYCNVLIHAQVVLLNINNNVCLIVLDPICRVMICVKLNAIRTNTEMDGDVLIVQ